MGYFHDRIHLRMPVMGCSLSEAALSPFVGCAFAGVTFAGTGTAAGVVVAVIATGVGSGLAGLGTSAGATGRNADSLLPGLFGLEVGVGAVAVAVVAVAGAGVGVTVAVIAGGVVAVGGGVVDNPIFTANNLLSFIMLVKFEELWCRFEEDDDAPNRGELAPVKKE